MNDHADLSDGAPAPAETSSQRTACVVLAALLFCAGLYTLREFLAALTWAVILALALWDLHGRVLRRCKWDSHRAFVPSFFIAVVALAVVGPLAVGCLEVAREAHGAVGWIHDADTLGFPEPAALHRIPLAGVPIDAWWERNLSAGGAARELVTKTAESAARTFGRDLGLGVARRSASFVFTLLALFFLLRDGEGVAAQARRASCHAFGPRGERILRQMAASVRGTVNGLVLVGVVEGLMLGCFYVVAGVPHPAVFGAVTAVAAMIPFVAPVVFLVVLVTLAAKGALAWGVATFCVGMTTTFIADHFVRPSLIGGSTKLPFIWVLLGILGGVGTWGILGLFIGPAIMAALIMLWREFSDWLPAARRMQNPGAGSAVRDSLADEA